MLTIPTAFTVAKNLVYDVLDLACSTPIVDKESSEYAACSFTINKQMVLFRLAKVTPTKIGQFVTLWKRSEQGPIAPFELADAFEFVVVSVGNQDNYGQFIFPKTVLYKQGIIAAAGREGKRAFRVYPSWDTPTSKQAQKTQDWQLDYFYLLNNGGSHNLHLESIREIFK